MHARTHIGGIRPEKLFPWKEARAVFELRQVKLEGCMNIDEFRGRRKGRKVAVSKFMYRKAGLA